MALYLSVDHSQTPRTSTFSASNGRVGSEKPPYFYKGAEEFPTGCYSPFMRWLRKLLEPVYERLWSKRWDGYIEDRVKDRSNEILAELGKLYPKMDERSQYGDYLHRYTIETLNHELKGLQQVDIRRRLLHAAIEIPEQFREGLGRLPYNLTDNGLLWANAKLRESRRESWKFWVGLLVPVLALIVSILGLLVAYRKSQSPKIAPCCTSDRPAHIN